MTKVEKQIVREFLAKIGRKGGLKPKNFTKAELRRRAKQMRANVRAREARRHHRSSIETLR
jgi:hypothetical protein